MSAAPETWLALALLIPWLGAALIPLFHDRPDPREAVSIVTATLLLLAVTGLVEPVLGGARPTLLLASVAPGLDLAFTVEPLGLMFALVASGLWIVTSVYSLG